MVGVVRVAEDDEAPGRSSRDSLLPLAAEQRRQDFNRAFRLLGLDWYWEAADYHALMRCGSPFEQIRLFLDSRYPALRTVYDTEALARQICDCALEARFPDGTTNLPPARPGWTAGPGLQDSIA